MAFIKAENAVPEETERHDWRRQKKAAEEDGTPGKNKTLRSRDGRKHGNRVLRGEP